jgi:hypothetical protein
MRDSSHIVTDYCVATLGALIAKLKRKGDSYDTKQS